MSYHHTIRILICNKRCKRALALANVVLLTLTQLLLTHPAQAFKPNTAAAPLDWTHGVITQTAVNAVDAEIFAPLPLSASMKKAREKIKKADADVDLDHPLDERYHFDSESFEGGQLLLAQLIKDIKTQMDSNNVEAARTSLGTALHPLQDFYSHSTWVELNGSTVNPDLGRPGRSIGNTASASEETCKDCGTALPTDPADCPNCRDNVFTSTRHITTGYFNPKPLSSFKPAGKCSHGGFWDATASRNPMGGINKDTTVCSTSPHFFLHDQAAAAATAATKQFILNLKDPAVVGSSALTLRQLKILLGGGPTLAIVMDTTGSMGTVISGAKQQAIKMVDDRIGTPEEPGLYILVPFNDPSTGPVTTTSDPTVFKNAINALSASGGGDCPELAMTGIQQALAQSDPGGTIFTFTDADPKDAYLAASVKATAAAKNIKIYPVLFGSCSSSSATLAGPDCPMPQSGDSDSDQQPRDSNTGFNIEAVSSTYTDVANSSGGQVFALSSTSEAGNITKLADFLVRSKAVDLLSITSTLSTTAKTFSVPVDSTLSKVTFSASGTTSVTVKRPNGTVVGSTDAGVSFVSISNGAIYSINAPVAGSWSVTLSGSGSFSLNVSGESTMNLTSFKFVKLSEPGAHSGYANISGFPVAGRTNTINALMDEGFSTAVFELRDKGGALLQNLGLVRGTGNAANEFVGDAVIPSTPFVVYVTGVDTGGKQYQRLLSSVIQPQSVVVNAPGSLSLQPGQSTLYAFQITNLGETNTFKMEGTDDKKFVVGINPTTVTLNKNETKTVTVELLPPSTTAPGVSDTLTVTATGTTITGISNFAVVESTVTPLKSLAFSQAAYTVNESAGSATILINRAGDLSTAASVDYATADGTARQRTDYITSTGTLNFAPGETAKSFTVLLINNAYVDGDRTVNLKLSNVNGAALATPSTGTLTIRDNDAGAPTANPLDDAQFFVRQHYYDFLSRLPDNEGLGYWSGEITQCGINLPCLRDRRVSVSNAFFFEAEYQQTGSYVFRLYRAAYGNNQPFPNPDTSDMTESKKVPSYAVFSQDRARVVGGANLAQSQLEMANLFVSRPEFLSKYPASLTGPQFVDAVLSTIKTQIGVDLSSQRDALITLFNQGGRGAVMYRLADDNVTTNPVNNRAFVDAEYNRAFVTTQYFGYLRRDADIGGLLFWLEQVNRFPLRNIMIQNAMVCSFITSQEYQERFSSVVTHSNKECPQ